VNNNACFLSGKLRAWSDGCQPQSVDPHQNGAEHFPGYANLGQLEDDLPGMPHDPADCFDKLGLEALERPVLEPSGQGRSPQKVAQIVGRNERNGNRRTLLATKGWQNRRITKC